MRTTRETRPVMTRDHLTPTVSSVRRVVFGRRGCRAVARSGGPHCDIPCETVRLCRCMNLLRADLCESQIAVNQ